MPAPKYIAIDTSIFDGAGYNFDSPRMRTFRETVEGKGLKLLDPDPLVRERNRHIREKCSGVASSLTKIERSLPIVKELHAWPQTREYSEWNLSHKLRAKLAEFLAPFEVIPLGYDLVDMQRVMTWHDYKFAPFGSGKKNSEFPDAIAISILERYADRESCQIAVISTDWDWERASEQRFNLMHFSSLDAYLEKSVGDSPLIGIVHNHFDTDNGIYWDWVKELVSDLPCEIEDDWNSEAEIDEIGEIEFDDFYVISEAEAHCLVAFSVTVHFKAKATYQDEHSMAYDRDGEIEYGPNEERLVDGQLDTGGVAKVKLSADRSGVDEITALDIEAKSCAISFIGDSRDDDRCW